MPSLRRTASSPSVRSSPYGYASSFTGAQAARGHGHRRSSGSETSSRRVLADIEWWRVTDGQCDPATGDLESEEPTRDVVQNNVAADGIAGVAAVFNVDTGVEHPLTLSAFWPSATDASSGVPTVEFAALTIAPQTPLRARHGSESSFSSLESTPEAASLSFDSLRFGLSDMEMDIGLFEDHASLASALGLDSDVIASPRGLARAHTFADCLFLQDDFTHCFPDSPIPTLLSLPSFLN